MGLSIEVRDLNQVFEKGMVSFQIKRIMRYLLVIGKIIFITD
jgi:hypothetical protein